MQFKFKTIQQNMKLYFLLACVLLYSCKIKDKGDTNNLIGNWKIVKVLSLDNYEIGNEDIKNCIGKEISFLKDSIVNQTECFSESCSHPNYTYKRVNTLAFFENDTAYINHIGFHSDSITVAYTSCNSAYFNYIKFISEDTICISADNKAYIFTRANQFMIKGPNSTYTILGIVNKGQ